MEAAAKPHSESVMNFGGKKGTSTVKFRLRGSRAIEMGTISPFRIEFRQMITLRTNWAGLNVTELVATYKHLEETNRRPMPGLELGLPGATIMPACHLAHDIWQSPPAWSFFVLPSFLPGLTNKSDSFRCLPHFCGFWNETLSHALLHGRLNLESSSSALDSWPNLNLTDANWSHSSSDATAICVFYSHWET